MFDVWCPVVASHVLRWWCDVVSVAHPDQGAIDVLIRCDCDQLVLLRTGSARHGDEMIHGVDPDDLAGRPGHGVRLVA